MPAYLIVRVDITDPEQYREYMRHTPRIIAAHGGRFIARGAEPLTLEGPPSKQRVVVIEFPSMEQAKTFYDSPDYRRARAIRADAGSAHIVAVEGYPDADWQAALAASAAAKWD
jgi:uncharacterized protein (DUF1330 family)